VQEQHAFDEQERPRLDGRVHADAPVGAEAIARRAYRPARAQHFEVLEEELGVDCLRNVPAKRRALDRRQLTAIAVVGLVGERGDAIGAEEGQERADQR
jgi:hypothetical protein